MLAKFTLSYMDFVLSDASILELTKEEIEYLQNQLTEAVDKGSTSHWYEHQEVLQVLINLIRNCPKNLHLIGQANSFIDLLIKSMHSDELLVQKKSIEAFVHFHSMYELFTADQISQSTQVIEKLSSHEDTDVNNLAVFAQFLIETDTAKSK